MALISPSWQTQRLTVRDATLEEVPTLTALVNACSYVGEWDNTFGTPSEDEVGGLARRSIASREGNDDLFTMQSIRSGEQDELLGYYHIMYNRPQPRQVGVSMFVIHPRYHGQGYGSEVVAGLAEGLAQPGAYDALLARVYLKNWPAMRFWTGMGFTSIIRYEGDPVMTEDAYASLLLERPLR